MDTDKIRITYTLPEGVSSRESNVRLRFANELMTVALVLTDTLCLIIASYLAILLRFGFGKLASGYLGLISPLLFLYLGIYAIRGLYPGIGLHPVEELRRLSLATSSVYVLIASYSFIVKDPLLYSRLVFGMAWILSLWLLPLGRSIVRELLMRIQIWGIPVAVFGPQDLIPEWVAHLRSNPKFGLVPVLGFNIADFTNSKDNSSNLRPLMRIKELCLKKYIRTALILSQGSQNEDLESFGAYQDIFHNIILVDIQTNPKAIWVNPFDLGGMVGYDIRHELLNPMTQAFKRFTDLVGALLALLFSLPILILAAIAIKLDSPGPVFFKQDRLGKGGMPFKMWKFRTMYSNAQQVLTETLAQNPSIKQEWDRFQKISNDPRVTRVGKFLRRFSLDELPQVFNVITGEMSLIGPRPFFKDQVDAYGDAYEYYLMVRPGMTGLWQVSGRNKTTFRERALWDKFYVRNWSVWLEIYIVIRTVWVVISAHGAY